MNKYEKKILEIENDADGIIEMLRSKKMSRFEKFIDFFFTNSLTLLDGLNVNGTYYLVTKNNSSKLVHISKELNIEKFDVNSEVQNSTHNKKFEYNGNYYKTFRKIR